ncbi:MAG: hypothetical protein Q9225_007185 [Loekoesia sp. 1 TL-2023]
MRSSMITASAAFVAGAAAWGNSSEPIQYTTEIVTAYTTYCPAATQITHGAQTYTVTEATTLTITNCPCTVTKPVSSAPVVYCSTCPPTSAAPPVVPTSSAVVPPAPVSPVTSVPTVAPIPTTPAVPVSPVSPVSPVVPIGTGSPAVPVPIATGSSGPVSPPVSPVSPPVSPPIYANNTVPAPTGSVPGSGPGAAGPSGTGVSTPGSSPVAPFKGAAPKMAASGASLAGLLGLAAFFL